MLRLISNQLLISISRLALPYVLIYLGYNDWHEMLTRIMVVILLGRGLLYSSYTSIYIEDDIKKSDNPIIKYTLVCLIILGIYIIDAELFTSFELVVFIFFGVSYEDYSRREIYHGRYLTLNVIAILTFAGLVLAGVKIYFIALAIIPMIIVQFKCTHNQEIKLTLRDVRLRTSYILSALLGYFMGGGYLLAASDLLGEDIFAEFRYVLLIFVPVSFLSQVADFAWFQQERWISRGQVAALLLITTALFSSIIGFYLITIFDNWKELIFLIVMISVLIAVNTILRLWLRQAGLYNQILIFLLIGSVPYLAVSVLNIQELKTIYLCMLYSQVLLALAISMFLIQRHFVTNE